MSQIAIDVAMQHLRADSDDQVHVQLLLDAAEQAAQDYINRKVYKDTAALATAVLAGEAGDDPIIMNAAVTAACLLILGTLYANREDEVVGVSTAKLPFGSRSLLTPYRIGMGI